MGIGAVLMVTVKGGDEGVFRGEGGRGVGLAVEADGEVGVVEGEEGWEPVALGCCWWCADEEPELVLREDNSGGFLVRVGML